LNSEQYLLADVFETFRDLMLRTHKLDPAYYFSLPQLSWDAMLKMTGIELDLLSDPDKERFEKAQRNPRLKMPVHT